MRWLGLLALAAALSSCGEQFETEEGPDRPCNENPWSCPEGQTCWPDTTTSFACLNDGPGEVNAPCALAPGSPECREGLICYVTQMFPGGACRPFCDPSDPDRSCPDDAVCDILRLSDGPPPVEVRVCRPY